jgi:hypothetical protein
VGIGIADNLLLGLTPKPVAIAPADRIVTNQAVHHKSQLRHSLLIKRFPYSAKCPTSRLAK